MYRFYLRLVWVVVLAIQVTINWSQAYNFRQVSIQQGLPQSQAYAILFDEDQRAWIGTQGGGLCRYDGSEFVYLTKNDSLLSNRVFSLQLIKGEIWVGQRGGVSVFNTDAQFIRNYRLPQQSAIVNDLIFFDDKVYAATDMGLYQSENHELVAYSGNVNLMEANLTRFFTDGEGKLWICSQDGLLSFSDPFTKINKARGLPVNEVECVVSFEDKWLIGTYGGGVLFYDKNQGIYQPDELKPYSSEIITTMFVSGGGEIWIGTQNNGVYQYSMLDKSIKNYRTENGLANNNVQTILADRWNNIWIGTSGGGISIFQNSPFIKYSTESGLNGNYVYSVVNDRNNNIWLGTEGTGALRINDTSATLFDEDFGFCSDKVRSILLDNDGDVWFGTEGSGLGIFSPALNKDTIFHFTQNNGLTSNWIKGFAQNETTGEIYIATVNGGIMRVNKEKGFPPGVYFSKLKITSGKLPDRISHLFMFNDKLWFLGDENSYGFISKGHVHTTSLSNVNLRNAVVYNDHIWIGSFDNGILQLTMDGDSVKSQKWITTSDGIASNTIYQLIWDNGDLWVGSEKGLDRLKLNTGFEITEIVHYGSAEGFEGVETNGNASYRDEAGNLWFGTVNGLYVYKGGGINYAQKDPPYLMLNDFRIFYESIEKTEFASYFEHGRMTKPLLLPYDKNHIGFSFKAIHYTHAGSIRYRWKLSGIDASWTPPSTSHEATYGNLLPGKYTFSVKASITDSWEVEPIEIAFEIDQPYWQKWGFKFMYYSAIFLVVLIVFLVVLFRLKRKNKRLREKLEMEKNLIELEQKALRLQMNPHFIFNVLNSIHNLIILNDPDKARYALAKFSKLMRRVLENSREKMISVDNEIETLENYVQLERLTSGVEVDLDFEVDENLDSAEEILPPLMIQPFVENALIHGIKNLDKRGVIKVGFKLISEHLLECSIEDNGRGREHAAKLVAQKENYHKSTALQVTEERLASLNKKSTFVPFEIIDLKDQDGEPSGTKIILRLEI
ncbi:MAG: histidine kinase [Bacteroidetes bacterium]|nr:histidine kinase [Bacteroidota bacterium]